MGAGERIVIVGANRGLGLGFARSYAASGAEVHACCREPNTAKSLGAIVSVHVHRLEVTDGSEIASAARAIGGPVDIYVHSAAIYGPDDVATADEWALVFRINVIAAIECAQAFRPLLAAGRRRLMVFLTSRMGSIEDNRSGGSIAYRSSKAALNAAVKSLSIELRPEGIAAVVMHPGWVRTDMGGHHARLDVETSVAAMRRTIDALKPSDSGRFLNYDGSTLPW